MLKTRKAAPMYAHPSRLLLALVGALLCTAAVASGATAATLNVDARSLGGHCSDSRTADQAQDPSTPWCTVSNALNAAPDGSAVQVRDGTYGAASVSGRHLVTGISVAAFPGEQPVLTSLNLTQSDRFTFTGLTFWAVQTDHSNFLTFTGNEITRGALFALNGTSYVFSGNVFHDMSDGLVVRRSSAITVTGNVFRDTAYRPDVGGDGIQAADNTAMTIHGNTFLRLSNPLGHSDAMELLGANDNITVDGNLLHATRGLITVPGAGRTGAQTKHLVVSNNEMTQTPKWAIELTNAPGALVVNNTIWDAAHGLMLYGSTRASYYNNVISHVEGINAALTSDDYNLIAAGPMKGAHDLRGDPRFVSQATLDYHLTANSPAVDRGSALFAPLLDRDGLARVGAPDLGAYEFQP